MNGLVVIAVIALGLLAVIAMARHSRGPYRWIGKKHLPPLSGRLHFRLPHARDRERLIEFSREPEAAAANGWDEKTIKDSVARFRDRKTFHLYAKQALLAIDVETASVVGVASLQPVPDHVGTGIGLGLQIDARMSGRAYGTELMAAMISVRRSIDPTTPLWVGTAVTNVGMQTIMERLGYSREPAILPYTAANGTTFDSYWYRCGSGTPHPSVALASKGDPVAKVRLGDAGRRRLTRR